MDLYPLYETLAPFVAGKWVTGEGEVIESIDPSNSTVIDRVQACTIGQVDEAIRSAREGFDEGEWGRLSPLDRSRLLYALADGIEEHGEDLAQLVTAEVGSPITLARGMQVALPMDNLRWFAEAARRGPRDGYEEALPLHHQPLTTSSLLLREPAGVVAAITAYNYPLNLVAWKAGAALAAGCSVVLMPSPQAVLSTIALVRLFEEAGFPPGAVSLVFGPAEVARRLATHDMVDMVSFTGSADVGKKIMSLAAQGLKKVVLELGGKSPNILLPGTDVAATVAPSVYRFCRNSGQGCGATTRTLVHRPDLDELVPAMASFMEGLVVDDPRGEATDIGPLINDHHRQDVEGYLDRAVESGATLVTGGGRPSRLSQGFYLEPTLVTGIANEEEIAQEELFAPVGVVIPYDDVADAVRIANSSKYGLNANLWGPTSVALDVARRIRSGTVTVNGGGGMRADAPWGGYGHSGVGREAGEEGLREFFEVKHVQWPVDDLGYVRGRD